MEEPLKRKHYRFRLSDEVADYIKEYAILNNLPYESRSEALERIIREYKEINKDKLRLDFIVNAVTNEVTKSVQIALKQSISKEINKVRLGTNNVDRNTQILIELLQGFMQNSNVDYIITTEDDKPPFMTEVEELIKKRITKQKQNKDSK